MLNIDTLLKIVDLFMGIFKALMNAGLLEGLM